MKIQPTGPNFEPLILHHDEERFFAWAARAGDCSARLRLIESGCHWVDLHARRLGHHGSRYEEAVAAGREALVRAVDRFDPTRGARLVTFAWPWIARAMHAPRVETVELSERNMVESPDFTYESSFQRVDRAVLECLPEQQAEVLALRFGFSTDDGEPLTLKAVADVLGLSVWQVRSIEAKAISHLRVTLDRVSNRAP